MSKVANFGGIGNVNLQQFPVLQLGTFVPQIVKALQHAGATYYAMQK